MATGLMSKAPARLPLPPAEAEIQPPVAWSQAETAQYIEAMAGELSLLARRAKLDLVSYLLDMARMESGNASRSRRRSGG
jgi:hypothetical protein